MFNKKYYVFNFNDRLTNQSVEIYYISIKYISFLGGINLCHL